MVYGSHDSKRLPWPEHQSILQKIQHCYEYCSVCAKNLFRTLPVTRSSPNRWRRGDIQNPHRSPVSESHHCFVALGVLAKCLLARPSCAERTSQFLSVFSQTYAESCRNCHALQKQFSMFLLYCFVTGLTEVGPAFSSKLRCCKTSSMWTHHRHISFLLHFIIISVQSRPDK